ncbi:L,D-transpeptidase [Rhodobium gokarnense]|uniref:Lipoprotein-anchoring transpeptidase ErfK/SrfK n=1 Tax=Rhodobium gokarnense TaxID=364296 RepID=A0ABT3HGM0_9HYPH|nr:L,D-transpeptidase [Rhodobium gokarnense]MCW2309494.1 lipoprotein-anchoring transpeptidase ErfK/SrfK [Rhodobium gokarnense]
MRKFTLAAAALALVFGATTYSTIADAYTVRPDGTLKMREDGIIKVPAYFGRGSGKSPIRRTEVSYDGGHRPGTIIIDTNERRLYYVMSDGKAMKYGIGVGRPGFQWSGTHRVTRKAEWPGWTPPPAMRKRQPGLPRYMPGGPNNPLGARAMYIGSTIYRIHGSNEPWTIGQAVSSGCIRLANEDVIDLYKRVKVGDRVVVKR